MPDSYRDLRVWQQAMKLAVHVYRETESFPKHELETQISLAEQLGYLREFSARSLLSETAGIGSSLTGLINSLRSAVAFKNAASGR
jgi:hypothetical protein